MLKKAAVPSLSYTELQMLSRLAEIPGLDVAEDVPLSEHTRFAIGGPARLLADASTEAALQAALKLLTESGTPFVLIGGGSNLVVSDAGFDGVVVRFTRAEIRIENNTVIAEAGAVLQDLVNSTIAAGLGGLHTMTRIPGWVGGAIYGNAGAYGHSVHEFAETVRFLRAGGSDFEEWDNAACRFRYRESAFKDLRRAGTQFAITRATLRLPTAARAELQARADEIAAIRDEKFPPTLRCAGSIFKNLILAELPESVQAQVPQRVIREGKVPSAYFLEEVGAKGMSCGGIRVADYHANLIYNAGGGTAAQVREIVAELKRRVQDRFGLTLEEEVQYVGRP